MFLRGKWTPALYSQHWWQLVLWHIPTAASHFPHTSTGFRRHDHTQSADLTRWGIPTLGDRQVRDEAGSCPGQQWTSWGLFTPTLYILKKSWKLVLPDLWKHPKAYNKHKTLKWSSVPPFLCANVLFYWHLPSKHNTYITRYLLPGRQFHKWQTNG